VKKPGSGSKEPNRNKVGKITEKQLEELAKLKIQDTNTTSLASAISMLRGTARSMGVDVVEG
jgi:large subunit ribosomal protein L11